jgi:hypothetical protein
VFFWAGPDFFLFSAAGGGLIFLALMKLHLPTALLAVGVTVFVAPLESRGQSTLTNGAWNTTISPAEGGTKSLISFSASGDWATNGYDMPFPTQGFSRQQIAWTGFLGAASNAWNFTNFETSFFVAPFGYFTNHTTGVGHVLNEVCFQNFEALGVLAGALLVGPTNDAFVASQGDWIQIVFSNTPTAVQIDLAFSNFNPGSYNAVDPLGTQFNLEIVPEPTTYALLALSAAGLGGYVVRRRRK